MNKIYDIFEMVLNRKNSKDNKQNLKSQEIKNDNLTQENLIQDDLTNNNLASFDLKIPDIFNNNSFLIEEYNNPIGK